MGATAVPTASPAPCSLPRVQEPARKGLSQVSGKGSGAEGTTGRRLGEVLGKRIGRGKGTLYVPPTPP